MLDNRPSYLITIEQIRVPQATICSVVTDEDTMKDVVDTLVSALGDRVLEDVCIDEDGMLQPKQARLGIAK